MEDNPWRIDRGHIKRIGKHIRIAPYEKHPSGYFTYVGNPEIVPEELLGKTVVYRERWSEDKLDGETLTVEISSIFSTEDTPELWDSLSHTGDGAEIRKSINDNNEPIYELVGYTEGGYCESAFPLTELYEYLSTLRVQGII